MNCNTPGLPVLHYLLEFVQTDVCWFNDAIHLSHLQSSTSLLPSIFPSTRVFSNEHALSISWPEYWSFSFSISPSSEYSRLIFFRIDWFDHLAVQGTLKSLLQHHSSKASILQLSLPYGPTLTSEHNYRKNYSYDFCRPSDVFAFLIHCLGLSKLFFQESSIF